MHSPASPCESRRADSDYIMSKSSLNKIKKQLLEQKERLEKEVGEIAKKGKRGFRVLFKSFGSKDDDHAANVARMDKNISLERSLEKSLIEVDKALEKVKQGKYGICEICNKKIEEQRLEILPTASICMKCGKARKG